MNLETVEKDLDFYKPILKKYKKLKNHLSLYTDPEFYEVTYKLWHSQKDYGIDNFITYILIQYTSGKDYINSHTYNERKEIQLYITRRLQ